MCCVQHSLASACFNHFHDVLTARLCIHTSLHFFGLTSVILTWCTILRRIHAIKTVLSVNWPNLTKIITLWEFLNFVNEVFHLQYEWSSDCWCIWKSLGVNACLQWRNVFSFHCRSVFVQFFVNFSSLSLTAHAR
jgi:hypothetical protein